jgi:MFS family permease
VKNKILTRTILLISFVSLFNDIASEMLYPIMPVYLRSIGFSILLIGILEGIAEATAGLSKGYFGNLSDVRRQRVPFVRWGYVLSAVSKPMMAIFTFPLWIFFARTLDRFGKGIRTSARDAILSDETTPEHKGKVFGFHRSIDTIGAAIGPIFALIFLYFYPEQYKWLFFIAFLPGILAMLLTLFLKEKTAPRQASSVTENPPVHQFTSSPVPKINFFSYFTYWGRSSQGYKLLVSGLLIFTLFNSSDAFLLLGLKNQGMSDSHMIGFYIFYNLVYALFSYPIGAIADRIGLKTMLITGLLIFSGVYFFFGFAASTIAFGLLFLFYGLYAAATEGISKALISNMASKSETATAIGFYTSFSSIFTMLSSTLAGILWYSIGPKAMFMISGVGVLVVSIYLIAVFNRKQMNSHSAEEIPYQTSHHNASQDISGKMNS